jgi:hypothetical protein
MNRKLQKLYEKMWDSEVEETLVEQSDAFSKFDLHDYTKIVYKEDPIEEGRGHGDKKALLVKRAEGIQCGLLKPQWKVLADDGWMVFSTVDDTKYTCHKGDTSLHPFRRYLEYLDDVRHKRQAPNNPLYMKRF